LFRHFASGSATCKIGTLNDFLPVGSNKTLNICAIDCECGQGVPLRIPEYLGAVLTRGQVKFAIGCHFNMADAARVTNGDFELWDLGAKCPGDRSKEQQEYTHWLNEYNGL
jgi:hypothetical protein